MIRYPYIIPTTGRAVTIYFGSPLARLLNLDSEATTTLAVTPNSRQIHVSDYQIEADHLAHECGHIVNAEEKGWRYLPWVLYWYAKEGTHHSLPERLADAYRDSWKHLFTRISVVQEHTLTGK